MMYSNIGLTCRETLPLIYGNITNSEAHPNEGGDYIDYFLPVNQHQNIQDRLSAAGHKDSLMRIGIFSIRKIILARRFMTYLLFKFWLLGMLAEYLTIKNLCSGA